MRKTNTSRTLYVWLLCLMSISAVAQTKIAGKVTDDARKESLAGISIAVKGKVIGTITDTRGNFALTTNTATPFTIAVTGVGFQTQEFTINNDQTNLNISLKEQVLVGQEVVVSASRVEESVLRSPVSVEKLDLRAIQSTPSTDFYGGLSNIKGIDVATQGLLFKSINMRGFGATGNPRTVQLIDGMDNSAPGLNFPVDNIVGIPEQDVESVEILPGAASALYGPNAIQGLILINSKSPFLYQGLSANVKTGIMSASNRATPNTGFYDASIRYAKAFSNKLAFKVNLSYIRAKDWEANNNTNLNITNGVEGNPDPNRGPGTAINYDGTNVYGDEAQANIRTVGQTLIANRLLPAAALALLPNVSVSRTGIPEANLVDYNTKSFKFNGAVHYRVTEKIEAIAQVNYGTGTTVYTSNGRYSLRDFSLTQAKLELRGDNFTLRGYTTQERSGKSYTAGLASIYLNEAIKPSSTWFGQYVGAFVAARGAGQPEDQAHLTARGVADQGRPLPGSEAYNTIFERVRNTPISNAAAPGGAFLDKSNLYHAEGVYNFKNQIKFADVLAGANVRQYQLRSEGTLFADQVEGRNGTIRINEFGAFAQASKSLFANHLKLSGSVRYDKNQNFKGQFTPRVSAVATFGDHNFRVSYQTGFRIPTTQNQYIDLLTPNARLLGGLPEFYDRYNLANSYTRPDVAAVGAAITQAAQSTVTQAQAVALIRQQVTAAVTTQVTAAVAAGQIPAAAAPAAIAAGVTAALPGAIQANAATVVQGLAVNANIGNLRSYQRKEFKPERVANYEIGYRGVFNKKLFVDAYYYYSVYTNFIGTTILLQPTASIAPGQLPNEVNNSSGVLTGNTRRAYQVRANSSEQVTASGWAIGLNYALPKGYAVAANVANNRLNDFTPSPELQTAEFNTPQYRWNVSFSKRPVANSNIGFAVAFRHQDSFTWEGFAQPSDTSLPLFSNTIVPAINNLDAQVNYKVSSLKSIVKVGATNLFGKPYFQAYGNPYVGTTYYLSLTFDELLN